MPTAFITRTLAIATLALSVSHGVSAQVQPAALPPTELPLFAVEIKRTTAQLEDRLKVSAG